MASSSTTQLPTSYEFEELREYALFLEAVIADKDRELEAQRQQIAQLREAALVNDHASKQQSIEYQSIIVELESRLADEQEQCSIQHQLCEQHRQTSSSLTAHLIDLQRKYALPEAVTVTMFDTSDDDVSNPRIHTSPPVTPPKSTRRASAVSSTSVTSRGTSPQRKPFVVGGQLHRPIEQGML